LGIIYWAFSQLISYGVWPWVMFVTIACAAAYFFRKPGIFLGHVLVAIAVVVFDVQWIQSEMRKPGWDGQPDQDFVFMFGVVLRILLVNTVLLPVSLIALRLRRDPSEPHPSPSPKRGTNAADRRSWWSELRAFERALYVLSAVAFVLIMLWEALRDWLWLSHPLNVSQLWLGLIGLASVVAMIATYWLGHVRARRATRRVDTGRCPNCGYDIRVTPGRCPECGHAVATPTAA
jgi:hypothetical protein